MRTNYQPEPKPLTMIFMPTAVVLDKESAQRDRIRIRLNECGVLPICFQDEWICLENINFIRPAFAVLRTDSYEYALRFVNLAKAIDGEFPIFVLSDRKEVEAYIRGNWLTDLFFSRTSTEGQAFRKTLDLIPGEKSGHLGPILIAGSKQRKRLLQRLPLLALSREPVLITGGKGVGKKSIAKAIHHWSIFRNVEHLFIDAGKITGEWILQMRRRISSQEMPTEGPPIEIIENIEKLPLPLQAQLLSLLDFADTGAADRLPKAPFITLARVDVETLVRRWAFRKDLYHRLSVFNVMVPPLCGHAEDILALADYFAVYYGIRCNDGICRLSDTVLDAFTDYHWPNNVSELKACVKRLVAADRAQWQKIVSDMFAAGPNGVRNNPFVDKNEIRDYLKCHKDVSLKQMKSMYVVRVEKKTDAGRPVEDRGQLQTGGGIVGYQLQVHAQQGQGIWTGLEGKF
ncbi:MAG: hypothetical protein CSA21_01560 [Deltaproteobacteria bacterium]|nr:MAG: hypothetical protein CSA21_01560 [Deltaproteobacteria bacterium]